MKNGNKLSENYNDCFLANLTKKILHELLPRIFGPHSFQFHQTHNTQEPNEFHQKVETEQIILSFTFLYQYLKLICTLHILSLQGYLLGVGFYFSISNKVWDEFY